MRAGYSDRSTKNKKGRYHRRRISGFLFALTILTVAVFFTISLPAFHLQNLNVNETRMVSAEEIISASGLDEGQHLIYGLGGSMRRLFELRYGAAEESISSKISYVDTVKVSLDFPGTIEIEISERVEVAYLAIPDGCVMIDKKGYALRINPVIPDDIPVIEGIRVVSLKLGQPLTVSVTDSMQGAITMMGAIIDADRDQRIPIQLMDHVKKIRPAGGNMAYLTIDIPGSGEEMNVLSELGSGLADDMIWLRFALEQDALSGYEKGILDLTGEKRIFRPDSS